MEEDMCLRVWGMYLRINVFLSGIKYPTYIIWILHWLYCEVRVRRISNNSLKLTSLPLTYKLKLLQFETHHLTHTHTHRGVELAQICWENRGKRWCRTPGCVSRATESSNKEVHFRLLILHVSSTEKTFLQLNAFTHNFICCLLPAATTWKMRSIPYFFIWENSHSLKHLHCNYNT